MIAAASGVFWTLFGAFAQVGFVAGIAGIALWVKVRIEKAHDRQDEARRRNR
jgi:hypothetical protein